MYSKTTYISRDLHILGNQILIVYGKHFKNSLEFLYKNSELSFTISFLGNTVSPKIRTRFS